LLARYSGAMDNPAETRRAVERYFAAWTRNDVDAAYAELADDLEFIGPSAQYTSAAQFRPALVGFAAMTRGARVAELVVDGERAAMLYDCDLPPPAGTLRIASFFHVVGGKIRRYETLFDPTEFRKLLAQRQAPGG
jgi:ketosteroid isomerase-like protein